MRASQKPSKRDQLRLCSEVYDICMDCIRDNNATFIMALNQVCGFGHDRIKKVLDRYEELCREFTERENDGFSSEEIHRMIVEEIERLGFSEDDIYAGDQTFEQVTDAKKKAEKNLTDIRYTEAKKAFDHLLGLKERYSIGRSSLT